MRTDELWSYDEPHESGGNVKVSMTKAQAVAWMGTVYPGRYSSDEVAFDDWVVVHWAYPDGDESERVRQAFASRNNALAWAARERGRADRMEGEVQWLEGKLALRNDELLLARPIVEAAVAAKIAWGAYQKLDAMPLVDKAAKAILSEANFRAEDAFADAVREWREGYERD